MRQDVKPTAISNHACNQSTNGFTKGGGTCPAPTSDLFGGLIGASSSSKQLSFKRQNISTSAHEVTYQQTLTLPTVSRPLNLTTRGKDIPNLHAPYRSLPAICRVLHFLAKLKQKEDKGWNNLILLQ
jgi:hypothetical protein